MIFSVINNKQKYVTLSLEFKIKKREKKEWLSIVS